MDEQNTDNIAEEGWLRRTLRRIGTDELFTEVCFTSIGADKVEDISM